MPVHMGRPDVTILESYTSSVGFKFGTLSARREQCDSRIVQRYEPALGVPIVKVRRR
jgi:hypothetical protein